MKKNKALNGLSSWLCRPVMASALLCGCMFAAPVAANAAAEASAVAPASIKVTGTVVDESGDPIMGASVAQAGTANGAITDANGHFVINNVPEGAIIYVTYIGYTTQKVKATSNMKVVLREDYAMLEETVVVGYGTMKKSDLTGSTTSLRSDAITSSMAASPLEVLQGKAPGLAVFSNNQPGAAPTLRIRGSASINADVDPLIVVDGFALVDGDLNDINAADIESIEILKDASATAIYGSRGANGVVMVTTKKGAEGRQNINVHANMGIQMRSRVQDVVLGQEFVDQITKAYAALGNGNPFKNGAPTVNDVDWQREVISSTAITQDYGLSVDGSAGNTRYMLSGGYYNQEGLLKSRGYEKFSVHSNLDHKFNKWFTVGSSMQLTVSTHDVLTDPVLNDIFRSGWPTDPVYKEDGSFNVITHGEPFNPIASMEASTNRTKSTRFLGDFYGQVNFTEHLNYRVNVGFDTRNSYTYQFTTSQSPNGLNKGTNESGGTQRWRRRRSKLMDNILSYANQWDDHRMTLTGVYSWQDFKYNYSEMSGTFTNDKLGAHSFGKDNVTSVGSDIFDNRIISWTGRATYAYKDRYMFTATMRFDGSSRFGEGRKWGTFPSAGIAWRATEEEFLKDNPVITDLKLRASYGITGNQEIGNYQSLPQLATDGSNGNYADGSGFVEGYYETVGNEKLQWERTKQLDLGVDLSLWNRLHLNVDYYNRTTDNLLFKLPIPSTSGYSEVLSNVGKVNNQGIEIALTGDIYKAKDIRVYAGGNFTYNVNKIKELYNGIEQLNEYDGTGTTGLCRILKVGESVNGVYGYKSMGIIKSQEELDAYIAEVPGVKGTVGIGSERYQDVNGDGVLNISDVQCIGNVEPKYFYGINLGVEYKQFKLQVYGQGAWDYASMAGAENYYTTGTKWHLGYQDCGSYLLWVNNSIRNQAGLPTKAGLANMWSIDNPNGTAPALGSKGNKLCDRTNGNWAYFVLKNIQLSYDFSKLIKSKYIKGLAFNVNLQNFVTWANHDGYNPENGDLSNPYAKVVLMGVNVKF